MLPNAPGGSCLTEHICTVFCLAACGSLNTFKGLYCSQQFLFDRHTSEGEIFLFIYYFPAAQRTLTVYVCVHACGLSSDQTPTVQSQPLRTAGDV